MTFTRDTTAQEAATALKDQIVGKNGTSTICVECSNAKLTLLWIIE